MLSSSSSGDGGGAPRQSSGSSSGSSGAPSNREGGTVSSSRAPPPGQTNNRPLLTINGTTFKQPEFEETYASDQIRALLTRFSQKDVVKAMEDTDFGPKKSTIYKLAKNAREANEAGEQDTQLYDKVYQDMVASPTAGTTADDEKRISQAKHSSGQVPGDCGIGTKTTAKRGRYIEQSNPPISAARIAQPGGVAPGNKSEQKRRPLGDITANKLSSQNRAGAVTKQTSSSKELRSKRESVVRPSSSSRSSKRGRRRQSSTLESISTQVCTQGKELLN